MYYDITFSGRFNYRDGSGVSVHRHDDYQIQLVYGGTGHTVLNGREFEIASGDIILIRKEDVHEFTSTAADGLKTLEVKFMTEDPQLLSMIQEIDAVSQDHDSQIFMLFSRIIMEGQRQDSYYRIMASAYLLESLVLMRRAGRQKSAPFFSVGGVPYPGGKEGATDPFDLVAEYVSRHINHDFSLKDMSRECGYNQDYLYRVIKKRTGMTAIKYVNHIRMERIKSLIQHTELMLTEIAWNLGFDNLQYFSRFFKKNAGITASEYAAKVRTTFRIDY